VERTEGQVALLPAAVFPNAAVGRVSAVTISTLFAGVVNGILLGGLYALTALGLSMVFGVMRLVNVAHGELLILAAYLTLSVSSTLGIDPLLSMVPVAVLLFAIGYPIQRWVLNPLMPRGMEPPLLTAFGLSIIAQNLLLIVWKANTRAITTAYSEETITFVGVNVPLMYAIAFGLAILLMAGMHAFVSRTYLGKAIRAATQDPETARAMGINVEAVYAMTYSMQHVPDQALRLCPERLSRRPHRSDPCHQDERHRAVLHLFRRVDDLDGQHRDHWRDRDPGRADRRSGRCHDPVRTARLPVCRPPHHYGADLYPCDSLSPRRGLG